MKKLLPIISIFLLAQFSLAGHHESSHMNKKGLIGYEVSDDGEKLEIIAGDPSLIKIWVDYVEAHNQRDLEAIDKANADDMIGRAPNGVVVRGSEAHAAFLKNWFDTSNPSWEFVYAMANDVPQEDGSVHHWITSSYKVTDTIMARKQLQENFLMFELKIRKLKKF